LNLLAAHLVLTCFQLVAEHPDLRFGGEAGIDEFRLLLQQLELMLEVLFDGIVGFQVLAETRHVLLDSEHGHGVGV
jgi:hypothetical protein